MRSSLFLLLSSSRKKKLYLNNIHYTEGLDRLCINKQRETKKEETLRVKNVGVQLYYTQCKLDNIS